MPDPVDDITAFIAARLKEREDKALAATQGTWEDGGGTVYTGHPTDEVVEYAREQADIDHIVLNQPAAVLRDVEATRRILADVLPAIEEMESRIDGEWGVGTPRDVVHEDSRRLLRLIASRDSAHPDFRPEWAVED